MNITVDDFFVKAKKWKKEFATLRSILLECNVEESIKWGKPCYTFQKNNIVLIHGFKEYCALLFHKGALLKDANNILVQQTKNVQAARQIRFTNVQEIQNMKDLVKDYVNEAIEIEKKGLKIDFKETSEYEIPEEFQEMLDQIPDLNEAFYSLTPGRQRGYLLYFSSAKQSKTRKSRIDKCLSKIYDGKGLNDR